MHSSEVTAWGAEFPILRFRHKPQDDASLLSGFRQCPRVALKPPCYSAWNAAQGDGHERLVEVPDGDSLRLLYTKGDENPYD